MTQGETAERPGAADRPERSGAAMRLAAGLAVVAATAAAALPVTAMYEPGALAGLLGAAAAGGAGLTALLRAARVPPTMAVLISLAGLFGGLVALSVWLPGPGGSPLVAAVDAVRHSGARVLTSAVPVPMALDTVALPVCATWLAAAAAVTVLGSRRPAAAALPPVMLFTGMVVLLGPTRSPAYAYAAVLVAALVLFLGTLGPVRPGRAAGAAILASLLAASTVGLGPALFAGVDRQPPDPRTHVVPPYRHAEQIHPLSLLSVWAAEPDPVLLEVHSGQPVRLRWVTLPEFTGIAWSPAPEYRAAGALLPAMSVARSESEQRVEVTVTGLEGSWLPVPEGASEIRDVPVAVDVDTATVAAPDGLHPGLRYAVTAAPPAWDEELLRSADLPTSEAYDRYRVLPAGQPARLYEIAQLAAGTGNPYEQATQLAAYLRGEYAFDPGAPGGNGYPALDRFLTGTGAGGGRGTSEQFATAFAVLARSLGMPTRVVVGFEPGQPAGDGRYLVRAGDAVAWPEVYLEGAGWVPFDPTPGTSAPTEEEPVPAAPEPDATSTPDSDPAPAGGADRSDGDAAADGWRPETGGDYLRLLLVVVVGGGLLGLAAVAILRWRRRTVRLGRRDPAARVLGAWAELRAGLRLAGRAPATALVVEEVVGLAAAVSVDPLRRRTGAVAAAVNAAAFGSSAVAGFDSERVASDVRELLRDLRRSTTWRRRLTWWVDPRPLWWR